MCLTQYSNELNAGSILIRSNQRSVRFIDAMRELYDEEKPRSNPGYNEQDAMRNLIKSGSPLANHVLRIPQWKINALPQEIRCYDDSERPWEKGMFVVHFPGAAWHIRTKDPKGFLMRQYEDEIIWAPDSDMK